MSNPISQRDFWPFDLSINQKILNKWISLQKKERKKEKAEKGRFQLLK